MCRGCKRENPKINKSQKGRTNERKNRHEWTRRLNSGKRKK